MVLWSTASGVVALLLGAQLAASQAPPNCPAADGTEVTYGNYVFTVDCGVDYAVTSLSDSGGDTASACFTQCSKQAECRATKFVPPTGGVGAGTCYFYGTVGARGTGDADITGGRVARILTVTTTSSAAFVSGTQAACPDADGSRYRASSGVDFRIECGSDYSGNDLLPNGVSVPTFADCIDLCDGRADCQGVAYAGSNCYLKGAIVRTEFRAEVWGARRPVPQDNPSVTTTSTYTPPAPTSTPNGELTCPENDGNVYTTGTGTNYVIECFTDHPGNYNESFVTQDFNQCLDSCSTYFGCQGVSFNNGYCELKGGESAATYDDSVWSGRFITPAEAQAIRAAQATTTPVTTTTQILTTTSVYTTVLPASTVTTTSFITVGTQTITTTAVSTVAATTYTFTFSQVTTTTSSGTQTSPTSQPASPTSQPTSPTSQPTSPTSRPTSPTSQITSRPASQITYPRTITWSTRWPCSSAQTFSFNEWPFMEGGGFGGGGSQTMTAAQLAQAARLAAVAQPTANPMAASNRMVNTNIINNNMMNAKPENTDPWDTMEWDDDDVMRR